MRRISRIKSVLTLTTWICLILNPAILVSQKATNTILHIPIELTKPKSGLDINHLGKITNGLAWVVYSDRENNPTYSGMNGLNILKKVNFLELFYVVDDSNGYIHIFKNPEGAEYTETLDPKAIDYGWVKKEMMLIWKKCLLNDQEITKKVMIFNTQRTLQNAMEKGESSLVKFYQDPQRTIPSDRTSSLYQVFFVYKYYPDEQNPKSVLLGYNSDIPVTNPKDVIYGWVDYSRVVKWDHRVCILPNTAPEAIAERKQINCRATVLRDIESAEKFRDNPIIEPTAIYWNSDRFRDKYPGKYPRFPVLSDLAKSTLSSKIMKVGIMGEVQSESGSMDLLNFSQLQGQAADRINESKNINLIFVIDGTHTMESYFPKVSQALIRSMQQLKQSSNNHFRFAAVVYRDKDEPPLFELKELTENVNDIAAFLWY